MHQRQSTIAKVSAELGGVLLHPWRVAPLAGAMTRDGWRTAVEQRHLYRFNTTRVPTADALDALIAWVMRAQRADGGVSAYYSLLTGYAPSYPETTGYLIPTCLDYADRAGAEPVRRAADRMTEWLLGLQLDSGAFPAAFAVPPVEPSVFNSGQILMGLVRAAGESGDPAVLRAARRCGDWLVSVQAADGRWEGPTYKSQAHTYYTMVAWALAQLARLTADERYARSARANVEWALAHQRDNAWFDGINLPIQFLHFIAYLLQGLVETGRLIGHDEAIERARRGAWKLLRAFEIRKWLAGDYGADWKPRGRYACLTGNAQMACVWLSFHELTGDLRWLNAALKINELVKETVPQQGPAGVRGGVAGSYPVWGRYQTMRYINWGAKFLADALLSEQRALERVRETR